MRGVDWYIQAVPVWIGCGPLVPPYSVINCFVPPPELCRLPQYSLLPAALLLPDQPSLSINTILIVLSKSRPMPLHA